MNVRDLLALPPVLTVPAAGVIVGLGRSASYDAARRWLESDGREGIPVFRLGRRLVCPTAELLRRLGIDACVAPSQGVDRAAL